MIFENYRTFSLYICCYSFYHILMNWNDFCNFWVKLGSEIQNWFVGQDSSGLNPFSRLIIAICLLIVGRIIIKLLMTVLKKAFGITSKLSVDISVKTFSLSVMNVLLNIGLAIIVLLVLKVDLTSVSSILSAGTVAIGLSLQDLISAFASGVVLLKTKHFRTGDYISIEHSVGVCEGTVSSIGLIATTLETYDNQHIVVPNNKVLQGVITNYTFNPTRRCVVKVKVHVSTDVAKAREIITGLLKKDERILANPSYSIVLSDIDEFSITIATRFFVKNKDYWDALFYQQEQIMLALRDNGIRFPDRKIAIEQ